MLIVILTEVKIWLWQKRKVWLEQQWLADGQKFCSVCLG